MAALTDTQGAGKVLLGKHRLKTVSQAIGGARVLQNQVPTVFLHTEKPHQPHSARRRSKKSVSDKEVHERHLPHQRHAAPSADCQEHEKKTRRHVTHSRHKRRKHLYHTFRQAAKLAIWCARQASAHILRNKLYDEISPYISGLHFHDYDASSEGVQLMFDPSKYKANKQLRVSEDAKRILSSPPHERSEKDVYYAQIALRTIKAIGEYPVRMQRKIMKVGQYERYEAKRVIVRQGHPASSFYFILSGSVVVMVSDPETKVAKPVAYLYKGMPFGELAIINRSLRQSTIVAKETVELLSIDIIDFMKIFMSGGVKNLNDPDHNEFLRSLSFLDGWPIEVMADYQDKCIFHFFKVGEVLSKDSNYSDWIFIVKSGSLAVLKKLKRVGAYEWKKKKIGIGTKQKTEREKRNEKELRNKQRRFILPDIRIPLVTPGDEEDDLREMLLPAVTQQNNNLHNIQLNVNGHPKFDLDLIDLDERQEVTFDAPSSELPGVEEGAIINRQQGGLGEQNAEQNLEQNSRLTASYYIDTNSTNSTQHSANSTTYNSKCKNNNKKKRKTKKEQEEEEIQKELEGRQQQIRTITQDLDSAYQYKDGELTEADRDPQFVHVQTLTKGQVFGVAETVLGRQPSLCIISNGAECVMLNKYLYLQHAPDGLITKLRQQLCPYPSDDDLQSSLQTSVDWQAYKNQTFQDTLRELLLKADNSNRYISRSRNKEEKRESDNSTSLSS